MGTIHPSDIVFKDFNIDEYDHLMQIWRDAGLPVKNQGRDRKEEIERELNRGIAEFIFAEIKSELAGVVLATHDGRKGWINRLAVLPEYRQSGVGKQLVLEAERRLHNKGIGIIACLIEDNNTHSLEVFKKLGYIDFKGIHYLTKRKYPEV